MSGPVARMNPALRGLECLRCGAGYDVVDLPKGCPRCFAEGHPANVTCVFDDDAPLPALPVLEGPDLGQGGTPLFRLRGDLAQGGTEVWVKNESANPTGSHKDRFSSGAVGRAAAAGYEGVVAASSGNAALSLAAYAAHAGLRCVMAVTTGLPPVLGDALRAMGAEVHVFDDYEQRWTFVAQYEQSPELLPVTNFVTPVVGSSPYGIAAFAPLATEIRAVLGSSPDVVVVPSSRGDLASGISLAFAAIERAFGDPQPRIYLVEPIPRLEAVLERGADVRSSFPGEVGPLLSIAGDTTNVQSEATALRSGGGAVSVGPDEVRPWHERAWRAGLPWEISSNTVFPALGRLLTGTVGRHERIVLVATSHGFKGL